MKTIYFLTLLLTFSLFTADAFAQSVSNSADNMFTEKNEKTGEEIVDGIKEAVSETEAAVEKTVGELEEAISNEGEEATDETDKGSDAEVESEDIIEESENTEAQGDDVMEVSNDPVDNIIVMALKNGEVIIELKPELAPKHAARVRQLTKEGFYDGVAFHRVIEGFMAQTGDPTGTGRGGSGKNIEAEFNEANHIRGTVSMARAADPNSADSQFFIMFDEAPHLDGNYTVFGQVISGMENIDNIKKGYGPNGMVSDPDSVVFMKVASDIAEEERSESLQKIISDIQAEGSEEEPEGGSEDESAEEEAVDNEEETE